MEWTDEIRDRCADWCACYGEAPCYTIDDSPPCADCRNGLENPDWKPPTPEGEE